MEFNMPKEKKSIIKVIGVGGGGSNAVNHMYNQGIVGVDFIVCNTDRQALDISPVPHRIQLGPALTDGRGAGMQPEVGMNAAMENIEEIREILCKDTKMVFITAGMGGGTGTGAAPVIAKVAKELGILTVGIVTVPFSFEGRKRRQQAENGLEEMRDNVDTLLIINNERLRDFGKNMSLSQAFGHADNILTVAAKGIAEVISVTGVINVDFNDVNTVLKNSGRAIMGSAVGEGENRAAEAVQNALISPLLNDNDIHGAQYILLNITYGEKEVMMDEISEITDYIQDAAGATADVIWGHGYDSNLGDKLCITLIATGFTAESTPVTGFEKTPTRIKIPLEGELESAKEIKAPLSTPTTTSHSSLVEKEEIEKTEVSTSEENAPNFETGGATPKQEETSSMGSTSVSIQANEMVDDKKSYNLFDDMDLSSPEVENTTQSSQADNNVEEDMNGGISWVVQNTEESEVTDSANSLNQNSVENVVKHNLLDDDTEPIENTPKEEIKPQMSSNDFHLKNQERYAQLEAFTSRLKKAEGIEEFEKEPAFQRKNITLNESKPSEESNVSRFGLSDDGEGRFNLKDNNFLHDNVD